MSEGGPVVVVTQQQPKPLLFRFGFDQGRALTGQAEGCALLRHAHLRTASGGHTALTMPSPQLGQALGTSS